MRILEYLSFAVPLMILSSLVLYPLLSDHDRFSTLLTIWIGFIGCVIGITAISISLEIKKEERATRKTITDAAQKDLNYFQSGLMEKIYVLSQNLYYFSEKISIAYQNKDHSSKTVESIKLRKKIIDTEFEYLWTYYESKRQLLTANTNNSFAVLKRTYKQADDNFNDESKRVIVSFTIHMYIGFIQTLKTIISNLENENKSGDVGLKNHINSLIKKSNESIEKCYPFF